MIVLQTERLRLRHMEPGDAEFMLGLLNDPGWHRFISDRIRTLEGRARLHPGRANGDGGAGRFRLLCRGAQGGRTAARRLRPGRARFLNDVDIGYAFLPEYGG